MIIDHLKATPPHTHTHTHPEYSTFGKKIRSKHVSLAQQNGTIKTCLFGSTKWFKNFWHSIFAQDAWQMAHQSLTPAVDWLDAWIGQGGLLLLVSYLLLFWFYG